MMDLDKLLKKFEIISDLPNINIDTELKYFTKKTTEQDKITFTGEYKQDNITFKTKLTIENININKELLSKLTEYQKNNDKKIWSNTEETLNALKLLNTPYVEYYIYSENNPTAFISYNILGGIIRHA